MRRFRYQREGQHAQNEPDRSSSEERDEHDQVAVQAQASVNDFSRRHQNRFKQARFYAIQVALRV
jgi:hypothetical protein